MSFVRLDDTWTAFASFHNFEVHNIGREVQHSVDVLIELKKLLIGFDQMITKIYHASLALIGLLMIRDMCYLRPQSLLQEVSCWLVR